MDKHNIQFEMDGDMPDILVAHKYRESNVGLHFHRNLEIYGVVEGEVLVTIAGDTKLLSSGQMAVVNCMESHEYKMFDDAEIFFIHIGTDFLSLFSSLYKNKLLPRWLPDTEYNKILYSQIEPLCVPWFEPAKEIPVIKKHSISSNIIADIIAKYGLSNGGYDSKSRDLIEQVIQYIYDHYNEDITLTSLASKFYIEPKVLSKKLSRCIGVNLRMFINDIRVQRAMQMLAEPDMEGKTKKEIAQMCGFKNMETFYRVYNRNSKFFGTNDKK
ncbi:MAG: AraC family transcriptional regulator [Ruminococcus flavefaciens]|nr:AraC family transcriptional regulator [Ruminococcus flavefaciens]